jgi:hypothetical protein
MATLKAKKLQLALKKAQNVGRVEEAVTIDGCSIVLQNLATEDYELIIRDTAELDGAEYLHAYQIGHVSRSIVEIEGIDLRDVKFIEDDVAAGVYVVSAVASNEGQAKKAAALLGEAGLKAVVVPPEAEEELRTIRVERAEWIKQRISTWGREAISVAYRKFADLLVRAEEKAQEGIQFRIADESNEDKFRRLLVEAKALEENLPDEIIEKVLSDVGYVPGSTPEQLAEVARQAKEFAEERARAADASEAEDEQDAVQEEPSAPPPRVNTIQDFAREITSSRGAEAPQPETIDPEELMRRRQPLNRIITQPPVPVAQQQAAPVHVPAQIRDSAVAASSLGRSEQIAAIEARLDPTLPAQLAQERLAQQDVPELSRKAMPVDRNVMSIIDTKPVAGLNPKFRPIPK